jgi:hypothetical protein
VTEELLLININLIKKSKFEAKTPKDAPYLPIKIKSEIILTLSML